MGWKMTTQMARVMRRIQDWLKLELDKKSTGPGYLPLPLPDRHPDRRSRWLLGSVALSSQWSMCMPVRAPTTTFVRPPSDLWDVPILGR